MSKSDSLIESKSLRESVIDRTDVLDKVKALTMLPDDLNVSIEQSAEYYGVGKEAVNSLIKDNREELESDGLKVLKGDELMSLKDMGVIGKNSSSFTIIPRRAILRIGMLLRDSLVARTVRDLLLNIEVERKNVLTKPRTTSRVKPAIKDAFDTAEYLTEKLGIKIGIAQAACIRAVEKNSGLDLAEIAKCLPSAEHEIGYLNATQIGDRLGVNAAQANKMLLAKGLQEQQVDAKGKKNWRITEAGKQYGEEFPFVRNGHSDYQIRWNETVMKALEKLTEKSLSDAQLTPASGEE